MQIKNQMNQNMEHLTNCLFVMFWVFCTFALAKFKNLINILCTKKERMYGWRLPTLHRLD